MRADTRTVPLISTIDICYALCVIAQVALCALTPFVSQRLLSVPTYMIHFGVLGASIFLFLTELGGRKTSIYFGWVLFFMLTCVAAALASGYLSYDIIIKLICLWEMLLAMHVAYSAGAGRKLMALVKLSAWGTSLGFLMQYAADLDTQYGVFFLGLNKNYSGAMLLLNASVCLVLVSTGGCISRCVSAICFLCSGYMLVLSHCRTALFVLIATLVAVLFLRKILSAGWSKHAVLIAPIVLMILLMTIPALNEIEVLGGSESLTNGRENIYAQYFSDIDSWWLLGNLTRYRLSNAHNGALALLVSLGIVGYVVWYAAQLSVFEMVRPKGKGTITHTVAYVAFICCMLIACTEAIVYVQGQQISIMMSLFVYICRHSEIHNV